MNRSFSVSSRWMLALSALALAGWVGEAQAGSVPIVVKGNAIDELWPVPVRCGVPFPENQLKANEPVALVDEAGTTQIAQTLVTATWDPKGEKGVRWLLLDFRADKGKRYRLLFGGDAVGKTGPQTNAIANVVGNTIQVDTGKLRASCDVKSFNLFSSFAGPQGPMMAEGVMTGPYLEHEKRGIFRAALDPDASVILEETGPVRAAVKAEGWYTNDKGEKFGRFGVRVHFFRGESDVKVEHTFIFTGTAQEDRLRDIGIALPLRQTKPGQVRVQFGSETGGHLITTDGANSPDAHVYQAMDCPDGRHFEWTIRNGTNDSIVRNGEKATGTIQGNTDHVYLAAQIRDAWQQYPWELEWNQGHHDGASLAETWSAV